MPFKFVWLCELLEELFQQRHRKRATCSKSDNPDHRIVTAWIDKYDDKIQRTGSSAIAFLSSLFPERRPDRVYNVQESRLSQIFGRALGLGSSRARVLHAWKTRHGADFPTCVEQVMAECEFDPPRPSQQVTLEEIEAVLDQIAANSPYSSPTLKAKTNGKSTDELISPIIHRLQSWEAKWFVRMLLKSYSPIEIPEYVVLHGFHFMLPKLLKIQNSLQTAVKFLERAEIKTLPPRPSKEYEVALLPIFAQSIKPQLGVMIQRQPYFKARSIKDCCRMARNRVMSVERKYDGEYCQIHIDLSKGEDCIQIFSKSGKDSTYDREALHEAIVAGLGLTCSGCKIRTGCILEGELLVWQKDERMILPFHKIRKHVKHGGRFLGTDEDSPYSLNEQLMIVFYDLLLLDDKVLLTQKHSERRSQLKALVYEREGSVKIVERQLLDFSSRHAPKQLREAFASSIVRRWEGFVLKGMDDPYFSWDDEMHVIKLKKDYIIGLGDVVDLCIVGGRRNAKVETELGLGKLSWTMFHLACLVNKPVVQRYEAKPIFRIIDVIGHQSLCYDDILDLNARGKIMEIPYNPETPQLNVVLGTTDLLAPTQLFIRPFVVEIMGSGFEKPSNANFWVLRFPRKSGSRIKIHTDRDLSQTMSFDELQEMAHKAMTIPHHLDPQEDKRWIEKLLQADPASKYLIDKSQSTSPSKTPKTATTASLTPISSRKRSVQRSPILVRMDTSELTQAEKSERLYEGEEQQRATTESTKTPEPEEMARYLKRKVCESENSPQLRSSDKRVKRCGLSPMRAVCEIPRTPTDTSPAILRSFSEQIPVNRSVTKVSETDVLSEITNISTTGKPNRGRMNLKRAYTGSPFLGPRSHALRQRGKILSSNAVHIPTSTIQVLPSAASKIPFLPYEIEQTQNAVFYVSLSSAKALQGLRSTTRADKRHDTGTTTILDTAAEISTSVSKVKHNLKQARNLCSPNESINRALFKTIAPQMKLATSLPSLPIRPPILIGSSAVATKEACRTIWQGLRTLDASFTFSVQDFVTDIFLRPLLQHGMSRQQMARSRPVHMLLVNSHDTAASNRDLRMLAREITTRQCSEGVSGGSDRHCHLIDTCEPLILVFDYNILRLKLAGRTVPLEGEAATRNWLAIDWGRLCAADGNNSHLFCGVTDVKLQKGQGWGGRDAFAFEMKWDWTWLEELMGQGN